MTINGKWKWKGNDIGTANDYNRSERCIHEMTY